MTGSLCDVCLYAGENTVVWLVTGKIHLSENTNFLSLGQNNLNTRSKEGHKEDRSIVMNNCFNFVY